MITRRGLYSGETTRARMDTGMLMHLLVECEAQFVGQ